MQVYGLVLFVLTVSGVTIYHSHAKDERQVGEVAGVVVPVVLNFAKALFKAIIDNWVDKDNTDVVVMGRAFRKHTDGGTQVTVTDRASGVHVTEHGATLQASTNSACEKLVKELLLKGVMSVDDLHLPPTLPPSTLPPCRDNNGPTYCKPMAQQGYCEENNVFATFMSDNCYKTCTGC